MKSIAATLLLSALMITSVTSVQVKNLLEAESEQVPAGVVVPAASQAFASFWSTNGSKLKSAFIASTSASHWNADWDKYISNLGNSAGSAVPYTWLFNLANQEPDWTVIGSAFLAYLQDAQYQWVRLDGLLAITGPNAAATTLLYRANTALPAYRAKLLSQLNALVANPSF